MAFLAGNAALKLLSSLYCEDIFSAAGNAVANQHANVNTKNIKPLSLLKEKNVKALHLEDICTF